jgi:segregation and condensation protein A
VENFHYQVEFEDFKGPADVLLDLVRKRKIDIYQIRLSDVISDFLEYIRIQKGVLLDTLSSFLYIASILLEIKSNSIIPSQNRGKDDEDDVGIVDRDVLLEREKQFKIFGKVSRYYARLKESEGFYFIREAPIEKEFIELLPDILKNLKLENINYLASVLLKKEDFLIDLSRIYIDDSTITIVDEMKRINELVSEKGEVSFKSVTNRYTLLVDKIICFLSILELYKNEYIDLIQFESFGDIVIKKLV